MKGMLKRRLRTGLALALAILMSIGTVSAAFALENEDEFAVQDITDLKELEELEELVEILEQYGPDAAKTVCSYITENMDELIEIGKELILQAQMNKDNFINEVIPQIEAVIAEIESRFGYILDEIISQKDILEEKLAEMKALLDEKKAALESAGEELKTKLEEEIAELEKSIAEIEAAIAELEAAIAEIEAKMVEVKNAIAALKQEIEYAAAVAEDLITSVKTLNDVVVELVSEAMKDVEGTVEYIKETIVKINHTLQTVEDLIAAFKEAVKDIEQLKGSIIGLISNIDEKAAALVDAQLVEIETALFDAAAAALEELDIALQKEAARLMEELLAKAKEAYDDAYLEATTDTYAVAENSYYVALGDSSALPLGLKKGSESYVDKFAKELAKFGLSGYENLAEEDLSPMDCIDVVANNADVIAQSDLITLGFSSNTFITFAAQQLSNAIRGKQTVEMDWVPYVTEDGVPYVEQTLAEVKQFFLDNGLAGSNYEEYADHLTLAVESYAYAYAGYVCGYPELINAIRKVNPEALIIIVGMYNPMKDVVLDLDPGFKFKGPGVAVGEYLDDLVELTNKHSTAYAMLTREAIYVEAEEVERIDNNNQFEIPGFILEYISFNGENMHANEAGHEYIKDQILNALEITIKEPETESEETESEETESKEPETESKEPETESKEPETEPEETEPEEIECDKNTPGTNCPSKKFTDINYKKWYHLHVDYCIENGLLYGTGDTAFSPDMEITRGMIVTILYRQSGETASKDMVESMAFTDVKPNKYYAKAIAWAQANGIVYGTSDTTFEPEASITRQEMVSILCRYAKYMGADVSVRADLSQFGDVGSVKEWAKAPMRWAVAEGLIYGSTAPSGVTKLNPNGLTTRAEAASFIYRFCMYNAQ